MSLRHCAFERRAAKLHAMTKRSEAQTRFDLIDPALRGRGWQHPNNAYPAIRVEERDAAVEIIDGKPSG